MNSGGVGNFGNNLSNVGGIRFASELEQSPEKLQEWGAIVITLDEHGVAQFDRFYGNDELLTEGEIRLNYNVVDDELWLGPGFFPMHPDRTEQFIAARYAELRLTSIGEAVLVGLRDEDFTPIEP